MRVDRRGEGAREHTDSSLETGNQNNEDRSNRLSTHESSAFGVQRLIESDLIGIVLADLERIFEANDAFLRMVGYSRDDLRRGLLRWPTMTPPEYAAADRRALEEAREHGSSRPFEKEYLRKDGSRLPILLGIAELEHGSEIYSCFVLDLTERKRAEHERAQFLSLIDTVIASSPIGMAFVDRDLRYVRINQALAQYNGLSPEDHIGKTMREVLHDAADVIEPQIHQVLTTGEPVLGIEITVPQPSAPGTMRHWLSSRYPVRSSTGEILGVGMTATDVTEWKSHQVERERLLAQFQAVLRQMPAAVIIAEAPSGRLIMGNEQVDQIWRRPFLAARSVSPDVNYRAYSAEGKLLAPGDWPLARSITTGEVIVAQEFDIERGDGTRGTILVSSSPVRDASGKITAGVVTFTDITEWKQTDRERMALLAREQSARAEAERERERTVRLQAVTAGLANALSPADVAEVIVQQGLPAAGAIAGAVGQLDATQTHLELIGSFGQLPLHSGARRIPMDTPSAITEATRTGQPVWLHSHADILRYFPKSGSIPLHLQAFAAIPLVVENRVIGVLGLNFDGDHPIRDDAGRAFILTVAQQCAQALQRAHLYEAERRARERSAQLQELTAALSEALTRRDVARVVVEQGIRVLGAVAGAVGAPTESGDAVELIEAIGYEPETVEQLRLLPLTRSTPATDVARTGIPIWIPNRQVYSALYPDAAWSSQFGEGFAALPLKVGGRIIGVLGMRFQQPVSFTAEDKAFMLSLIQQCAQAMERAQLYEAEQRARLAAERAQQRTARLQAVTAALSEALTQQEVARVVVEQGVAALNAIAGAILLATRERDALEVVESIGYRPDLVTAGLRIPLDAPLVSTEVFRTGLPAWFSSRAEVEARYPGAASVVNGGEAYAAIPLLVQEHVFGVLALGFSTIAEFSAEDRAFILTLAQQCAEALERSRLYEAERAARAAAEAAVRLREQFLSIAAHELKTPLTTVKGYGQLLRRYIVQPELRADRIASAAEQVLVQAGRLEALISDLLDVSRVQQGRLDLRRVECDLVEIAREVLFRYEDAPERHDQHRLILDAPDSLSGYWDPARLDQVLTNLVSNAIKYSPGGGEIVVRVRRIDGIAQVSVSDEGMGIPEEEQTQLFQPFVRGEAIWGHISGAGLGLYISWQIIQQHRGTLSLDSQFGRGSTFTIRIPISLPEYDAPRSDRDDLRTHEPR